MSKAPPTQPDNKPSKLPFPLQDEERVIGVYRRHWLYLWPYMGLMLLFAVVPLATIAWLLSAAGALDGTGATIYWSVAAIYVGYWLLRVFFTWYRYHNDLWTITNQRLIDSYKKHPLNLRISTADLVNLQDMTVERNGLLRTMFDYGDVVCQTAGTDEHDFRLTGLPDPRAVQALVDKERDRERMRIRGGM